MLTISYKTQTLDFQQDILDLLCQIDNVLASTAKTRLYANRFGADYCISVDDYELLVTYREILYAKAKNIYCLKDFLIDDIIKRIKQLINRN